VLHVLSLLLTRTLLLAIHLRLFAFPQVAHGLDCEVRRLRRHVNPQRPQRLHPLVVVVRAVPHAPLGCEVGPRQVLVHARLQARQLCAQARVLVQQGEVALEERVDVVLLLQLLLVLLLGARHGECWGVAVAVAGTVSASGNDYRESVAPKT